VPPAPERRFRIGRSRNSTILSDHGVVSASGSEDR
jgi:hypothetical protein